MRVRPPERLEEARAGDLVTACACFGLRWAGRAVTQLYDEALRGSGLRITQFTLLAALRALEPVSIKELAEAAAADPTTLTRNLQLLEREGLVRIRRSRQDRRERLLRLTPRGQRAVARAVPHWERAQQRVQAVVGRERLRRLHSDLAILVKGVRPGAEATRRSRSRRRPPGSADSRPP
jgi:DNA-binding MarR family transcriptional regulator